MVLYRKRRGKLRGACNQTMLKEMIDFKYLDKGKDELNNLRHSHGESYEILIVRAGSGSVIVRDRLFALRPGAVYFINGMDTHCTVPEKPEEYYRGKLIVSGKFIDRIAGQMDGTELLEELFHKNGGTCVLPDEKTAAYIDAEFAGINRALSDNSIYTKIGVATGVMNILCAGHEKKEEQILTLDNRVSKILEYINENLGWSISLEDICTQFHVSRYYLCHLFKKTVGMTVFEYILSRRLSIARKYLLGTDMTLSQIADTAGFSSFSYFSKVFREYEGMPPSKFRAANRQK